MPLPRTQLPEFVVMRWAPLSVVVRAIPLLAALTGSNITTGPSSGASPCQNIYRKFAFIALSTLYLPKADFSNSRPKRMLSFICAFMPTLNNILLSFSPLIRFSRMHHEELSRHYSAGQTASWFRHGLSHSSPYPEGFAQLNPCSANQRAEILVLHTQVHLTVFPAECFPGHCAVNQFGLRLNKCVFRQVITVTRFRSGIPEWVP